MAEREERFTKLELLSPCPLYMQGVGHITCPTLKHIVSTGGEGAYNSRLNVLLMTKVQILESLAEVLEEKTLKELDQLDLFQIMMIIEYFRNGLLDTFRYFLTQDVRVDDKALELITFNPREKKSPSDVVQTGRITVDNYIQVRDWILRRNYIDPPKPQTKKRRSKRMIQFDKKLQKGRKQSKRYKQERKAMQLGNLVSKMSQYSNLNITDAYNLTVYQLYNQFFEAGNQIQLEAATTRWCIWGKEKFDFTMWYKALSER